MEIGFHAEENTNNVSYTDFLLINLIYMQDQGQPCF